MHLDALERHTECFRPIMSHSFPSDEHSEGGQPGARSRDPGDSEAERPDTLDRDERVDTRTHGVVPSRTPPSAADPAIHGPGNWGEEDAWQSGEKGQKTERSDEHRGEAAHSEARTEPDDDSDEEVLRAQRETFQHGVRRVSGHGADPDAQAAAMQRPPDDS